MDNMIAEGVAKALVKKVEGTIQKEVQNGYPNIKRACKKVENTIQNEVQNDYQNVRKACKKVENAIQKEAQNDYQNVRKVCKIVENTMQNEVQNNYQNVRSVCRNFVQNLSPTSSESDEDDEKNLNQIQYSYGHQFQAQQIQSKYLKKWKGHKNVGNGQSQQNKIEISRKGSLMEERYPHYREVPLYNNGNISSNSAQNHLKERALYGNSVADLLENSNEISEYPTFASNVSVVHSTNFNIKKFDQDKINNSLTMVQLTLEKSGKARESQILDQIKKEFDAIFTQNFYLVELNETLKAQNVNLLDGKADLIRDIQNLQSQLNKSKPKKKKNWFSFCNLKKKKDPDQKI